MKIEMQRVKAIRRDGEEGLGQRIDANVDIITNEGFLLRRMEDLLLTIAG